MGKRLGNDNIWSTRLQQLLFSNFVCFLCQSAEPKWRICAWVRMRSNKSDVLGWQTFCCLFRTSATFTATALQKTKKGSSFKHKCPFIWQHWKQCIQSRQNGWKGCAMHARPVGRVTLFQVKSLMLHSQVVFPKDFTLELALQSLPLQAPKTPFPCIGTAKPQLQFPVFSWIFFHVKQPLNKWMVLKAKLSGTN